VSSVARLEDAAISTTSPRSWPPGGSELSRRAWATRGLSDFWQHCLVAEGALDVATDGVVELWDYAAVRLVVEEAGGRCTTFDGGEPSAGAPLLSTNGALHEAAVALLGAPTVSDTSQTRI
jgi:histidinol-phosphatase